VKDWSSDEAKKLFEQTENEAKNDEHGYFKILENAASYDIDWALKMYTTHLNKLIKNIEGSVRDGLAFSHQDTTLLKKFFSINPDKSFIAFFKLLTAIISKTKYKSSNPEMLFYQDLAFFMFSFSDFTHSASHTALYYQLGRQIRLYAKNKQDKFRAFFHQQKDSKSFTILRLIATGLKENPGDFKSEIFEFIKIISDNRLLNHKGKLQYSVRKLITGTYCYFTAEQQKQINKIILSINSKREPHIYDDKDEKKRVGNTYGKQQFLFLDSIPESERKKYPLIHKRHQEFKRKKNFQKIKDREPMKVGGFRGIPGPVPKLGCERMNFQQWEVSFLKYGDSYERDHFNDKFSKREHAKNFKAEVTKNPKTFYPFIKKLIIEKKVSVMYIVAGLEGLRDGECHVLLLMNLFEKAINIPMNEEFTLYMIWITQYFIDNKKVSKPVLDFLIEQALHHPDPQNDEPILPLKKLDLSDKDKEIMNNLFSNGVNSVRGAAVERLPQCYFLKEFESLIFDTLFKVSKDNSLKVKACLLTRLAFMNHLDKEKTLQIFLNTVQHNEPLIFIHALNATRYIGNYKFKPLIPFFNKAVAFKELGKDISVQLAVFWLSGNKESYPILKELLISSEIARSRMPEVAAANIFTETGKIDPKSVELFEMSLNETSEDILDSYRMAFHRFKVVDFKTIFPWLKKYITSNAGARHLQAYYVYLLKCATNHPKECIELLSDRTDYDLRKDRRSGFHNDEPIKVLMAAYNSLDDRQEESHYYIKSAMEIFDKMLESDRLRKPAHKVLDEIEI